MKPFETIGPEPRWVTLYRLLKGYSPGEVVTYTEMASALGLTDRDRGLIRSTVRRAAREFEVRDRHALEAVRNVGYRVVHAPEHLRLAAGQQKRAGRALARGHSKAVNVDLNGVEPDVRRAFETVAHAFSVQMDFNRRLDVRQKNLEETLTSIVQHTEKTDAEVSELRARLERLEQTQE